MSYRLARVRAGLMRTAIVTLWIILHCVAANAAEVKWRTPLPDTLVFDPAIIVQGHIDPVPESGELVALVKQPGSTTESALATAEFLGGGLFYFTAELYPGINDITVEGHVLSVYYQTDPSSRAPETAKFTPMMPAHTDLDCAVCHGVSEEGLTLNSGMPELCLECHTIGTETLRQTALENEHSEKITPFCVGCHTPHPTFEAKLIKRGSNICTSCHKEHRWRSGHEEVVTQPCALCHDPHSSSHKAMLKTADLDETCKGCHTETYKPRRAVSTHYPVRRGPCSQCHLSHDEGFGQLLAEPAAELCDNCHEAPPMALHPDKLGDCSTCHASHTSLTYGLLKEGGDASCRECHEETPATHAEGKGKGKKGVEIRGCFQCHNPHEYFDDQEVIDTCGKCHSKSSEGMAFFHSKLPINTLIQCLYCHKLHGEATKRGMLYGEIHYPAKMGGCEVCHDSEEGEVVMRYEGSANCVRCHGDTVGTSASLEPEKIHAPITQEDCSACHNPHVRDFEKMLWDEPEKMCYWCHGIVMNLGPVEHGALEEGGCRGCHLPHFSEARPLLKVKQPELCLECHPKVLEKGYEKDEMIHGAVRTGRCGGCHSPHTSEDEKLIKDTRDRICVRCHSSVLADENGNPWSHLHGPVAAGDCTSCHELKHRHEKRPDDLFLGVYPPQRICEECHEIGDEHIPKRYRASLGRIKNGCIGCHDPHGGSTGLMLKRIH